MKNLDQRQKGDEIFWKTFQVKQAILRPGPVWMIDLKRDAERAELLFQRKQKKGGH